MQRCGVRTRTVGTIALGLALAGCGSGRSAAPAPAELAARARQAGVDVALVYVTAADGYTRAAGGLGPYGDAGFQDVYSSGRDDLRLTVEKRTIDAATCPYPRPSRRVPRSAARPTATAGHGPAETAASTRSSAATNS